MKCATPTTRSTGTTNAIPRPVWLRSAARTISSRMGSGSEWVTVSTIAFSGSIGTVGLARDNGKRRVDSPLGAMQWSI